jgi:putative CocE/NonD family hydrolase
MRAVWILVVALLLAPGAVAASAAEGPDTAFDYTALEHQLSQPVYPDTVTETERVPMSDGVEIAVRTTRPDPLTYPGLKLPVILVATPYDIVMGEIIGREELPGPKDAAGLPIGLKGYFAPRGYAVAVMALRGTGDSGGCAGQLNRRDGEDIKAVVEWLAARDWSNGRVGTIGHSFNGDASGVAAAQQPQGLETSVIISGAASVYETMFQRGVPYQAHAIGPLTAYPLMSVSRYVTVPVPIPIQFLFGSGIEPSQQYANAACGFNSAVGLAGPGMATGQYVDWHAERDVTKPLAAADVPLFLVHGVDDASVRMNATEWFFRHRPGHSRDKVWLGPWGHDHASRRGEQWTKSVHAWFDHHLQERVISTGPSIEAFMDTRDVFTAPSWTPADGATWYPDATDHTLQPTPPTQAGAATFTAKGNADRSGLGPDGQGFSGQHVDDGGVEFTSAPLDHDIVLFGLPELRLEASITGATTSLVTTVWRQKPDGTRRALDVCAMQPQLRNGVDTVTPVTPGETMILQPQCFTTAHHLLAGDQIVLRIGTGSRHHIPTASVDPRITVHTGPDATAYTMPIRTGAQTLADPFAPIADPALSPSPSSP